LEGCWEITVRDSYPKVCADIKWIISEHGTAGRRKWCQKTNGLRVCFVESVP
jgi:hypothetical protein